jgi:peptide/nickel transport system permease protein
MGLLTIFLVTMMVFLIMRLLPGDPLILYLSQSDMQDLSPEQVDVLRQKFGLDKSLPMQYAYWVGGVLQGDFGKSIYYGEQVEVLMAERIPITFTLGIIAFAVSGIFGISFGVISALRRGTWTDTLVTFMANIGITVPGFWAGILLIYLFALRLGWLPTNGYVPLLENPVAWSKHIVLPIICLSLFSIASLTRQTRSAMLEVIQQDYIRTAWAKGLMERVIVIRHTVKNALIPVITVMGLHVGMIFGGSVLIETVFNIPGVGRLMAQSVLQHDFQIIQAGVLMISAVVTLANLLVDISYGWLDPRIRFN